MREPNPTPLPGHEPVVRTCRIDDVLDAALRASLGGGAVATGPDGSVGLAAMMLAAGPPTYAAMVGHPGRGPLGDLRHLSIEFERIGDLWAGDELTNSATITEVGRVGASLGLGIEVRMAVASGLVAAVRVVAQLGSPAPAGAPALVVPKGQRTPDGIAFTIDEAIDEAAVLAWVTATGDEVPIHRADTPEAVRLGTAVVPGGLTAARLLDHATRAAATEGRTVDRAQFRFRRIVGVGVPVQFAFGRPDEAGTAVVGVTTPAGPAITAVEVHTVEAGR